ncbi:MAG: RibD family protein [Chloroflexota bacterium]
MLPRVVLYNAVSVDGRFDWIAPDLGQFYRLASFWKEDATLVGSETMLSAADQVPPEEEADFTVPAKDPSDTRPLLAIVDSRGRVQGWHFWRKQPYWRDAVAVCSQATPTQYLAGLRERHVDAIVAGTDRVDLRRALEELNARYGVKVVRVDSGGTLNGALLRAGLVDEVSLLVGPTLVGGTSPKSFYVAPDLTSAEGTIPVRLAHVDRLDDDSLWLRYEVIK